MKQTKPKKWYGEKLKNILIFCMLLFFVPFAPIGVLLMWKFVAWTKKTKWIMTGVLMSLFTIGVVGYFNAPPRITVNDAKDNKLSVDVSRYSIVGDLSSLKTITAFTINGKGVPLAPGLKFSYEVSLREGDNPVELVATNDNGVTKESLVIHRATKAELEARAKAEKEKFEQRMKEQNAKKAAKESEERAKAEKQTAEERAKADKEAAEKLAAAEEKAKAEKDSLDCNFWCWLTGGNKTKDATSDTKKTVATPTPPKNTNDTPKIGSVVTSGNFAFRVNTVRCGETTISWNYGDLIRYYSKAQGKFCRLNITVMNTGDYEDSISVGDQYLYNSKGQQWSYDGSATSTAAHYLYGNPLSGEINPGNSITGDLIYDIPANQMPVYAEFDGGIWNSSKKVSLQR